MVVLMVCLGVVFMLVGLVYVVRIRASMVEVVHVVIMVRRCRYRWCFQGQSVRSYVVIGASDGGPEC